MQPRLTSTTLTRRNLLQAGSAAALSVLCRPVFAVRQHFDVIIIGAGLAGLQAGRVLKQHGVDFLLLEGSQRIGGRVYTLDDLPGRPEAGGARVGTNYRALNQALAELNIKTTAIRPGAPQDVSGGTQRLPDAMHDSINPFVLTGKQVTSINTASSGIRLLTADSDGYTCRLCLVALPFSVLRRLDVQAPLSGPKRQAIMGMGYTPVTHVFMKPRSRFWLADGLSPNMWTDTDLGRVFTQSDERGEVIRLRAWIQGSAGSAGR